MRILIGSIAAVLLTGCASQPSSAPPSSASAQPVAAAAVAPAVPAAAPVAARPVSGAAGSTTTTGSAKSYPGYKMKQKNGTTVYCKKVAKIGSRFEEETCMTPAEMEQLAQKAEEDRQQFRRNQTLCGTGGCGGT